MTSCAVMQPTYLPWAGYFTLMASVDTFVILDDVQYERKSWQCRNRILVGKLTSYITVPVKKQPLTELIQNIEIDYSKNWQTTHADMLRAAYGDLVHGHALVEAICQIIGGAPALLVDLNFELISFFARYLNITTPLVRASTLGCGGKRSKHVGLICKAVGADHYVSPEGARDYMTADKFAKNTGLSVTFNNFDAPAYPQAPTDDYISHLSIIDVAAHCGQAFAADYIRGNVK